MPPAPKAAAAGKVEGRASPSSPRGNSRQPLPPPSPEQSEAIRTSTERVQARTPRATINVGVTEADRAARISPDHNDGVGWLARLQDVFATNGTAFLNRQVATILNHCREPSGTYDATRINSILAAIEGAEPENETQAMLALQMALTHELSLTALLRAQRCDTVSQYEIAASTGDKLMRTFALQAETLAKLKRGGAQTVRVVHVHAGANAIVGNVTHGNAMNSHDGGGGQLENRNQPHAPEQLPAPSACPMPQVRSANPERIAMPSASRSR